MLGVYLDEQFTFDYHCDKILKKINAGTLLMISQAKNLLSTNSLKNYILLWFIHICYIAFQYLDSLVKKYE